MAGGLTQLVAMAQDVYLTETLKLLSGNNTVDTLTLLWKLNKPSMKLGRV